LFKEIRIPVHPKGKKYYYIQRNGLFTYAIHKDLPQLFKMLTVYTLLSLIKFLMIRDKDRTLAVLKGTIDFFLGRVGKYPGSHKKDRKPKRQTLN